MRTWPAKDDPRAGGEDNHAAGIIGTAYGRSPRGRGGLPRLRHGVADTGTIPARAGRTMDDPRNQMAFSDDPRAGGEDALAWTVIAALVGRSPRGRGGRVRGSLIRAHGRTIPARAGRTPPPPPDPSWTPDDPRAGGEDVFEHGIDRADRGRSPRGRGGLRPLGGRAAHGGTIPARAGRTASTSARSTAAEDDPRAGGEDPHRHHVWSIHGGRSPRGRGGRHRYSRTSPATRTIPARAGRTVR